ncbi:MAG: hypothetical protein ACKO0Z_05820, partial [Betaproteobacteria bacterium]
MRRRRSAATEGALTVKQAAAFGANVAGYGHTNWQNCAALTNAFYDARPFETSSKAVLPTITVAWDLDFPDRVQVLSGTPIIGAFVTAIGNYGYFDNDIGTITSFDGTYAYFDKSAFGRQGSFGANVVVTMMPKPNSDGSYTGIGNLVSVRPNGWPSTNFSLSFAAPAGAFDSGVYACQFVGTADVSAGNATLVGMTHSSVTNKTTFSMQISATDTPLYTYAGNNPPPIVKGTKNVSLSFANLSSDFSNLEIMRAFNNNVTYPLGYSGKFTTEWLARVNRYARHRYLNNPRTNDSLELRWGDRSGTNWWGASDYWGSWEFAFDHSEATGKDMWINIPHMANDDYVLNLAQMAYARVGSSGRNIVLEYSNELWNSLFDQVFYEIARCRYELSLLIGYAASTSQLNDVVSITRTSNVVTVATVKKHPYTTGQAIHVCNSSDTTIAGPRTVTVIDPHTFSFASTGADGAIVLGTGSAFCGNPTHPVWQAQYNGDAFNINLF